MASDGSTQFILTVFLMLASALVGGYFAKRLRQPLVLGYIVAGALVGSFVPQLIHRELLDTVADAGVTLLLFTLGIEFSFHRIRRIAEHLLPVAIIQILLTMVLMYFLLTVVGYGSIGAILLAVAAAYSSTAVVVRFFSERGELDSVPGEVATTWLVLQDLSVIPVLFFIPVIVAVVTPAGGTFSDFVLLLASNSLKAIVALYATILFGKKLVPRFMAAVAAIQSRELLTISTVAVVFFAAFLTQAAGLSPAIGAFIAGIMISDTSQNHAIFAEIRPLRDLFSTIFFISLGLVLPAGMLVAVLPAAVMLLSAAVIIRSVLYFGMLRYLGYHEKTATIVTMSLIPLSEFGFVIARDGYRNGYLPEEYMTTLIAMTFVSILVAAPVVSSSQRLYYGLVQLAHRRKTKNGGKLHPPHQEAASSYQVVICGYGRVGRYIGRALEMSRIPFVVIDYNHTTVMELRARGVNVIFGDPADREVLASSGIMSADVVVVAIPDLHTQELIISHAQTLNKRIHIITRTHYEEDQKVLKSLGVQTVIQPEFEAAISVIERLLPSLGVQERDIPGRIHRLKIEHGAG